jgi:hypothetical protein
VASQRRYSAVLHFKMQSRNPSTATTRRYGAIKNEMHSNQTLVRPSSLHNVSHASLKKAIFDDLSQAMSKSTPNLHSQPGSFLPSLSESTKSNTSGSFPSNVSRRTCPAKEESKNLDSYFPAQLFQRLVHIICKRGINLSESFNHARFVNSDSLAKFLSLILEVDDASNEVRFSN